MNAHVFQPTAGAKSKCTECGKTRNTRAHTEGKAQAELDAVAEARKDMLPEASAAADDAEVADALADLGLIDEAPAETYGVTAENAPPQASRYADKKAPAKAAKKAPAKKAPAGKKGAPTVRLWVGWRISNAAVLENTSVSKKLREAKPNSELDRFIDMTVEELRILDEVAKKFEAPGNTGPAVYSARTLRRRIAEGIAKLEDTK